jgi:hypothetical protein
VPAVECNRQRRHSRNKCDWQLRLDVKGDRNSEWCGNQYWYAVEQLSCFGGNNCNCGSVKRHDYCECESVPACHNDEHRDSGDEYTPEQHGHAPDQPGWNNTG